MKSTTAIVSTVCAAVLLWGCSKDVEPHGGDGGESGDDAAFTDAGSDVTIADAASLDLGEDAGTSDLGSDSGAGDTGGDTGGDAGGVLAGSISFPVAVSATFHDQVVIRGIAVPGSSPITGVAIGGVAATTTDQFANWEATIDLQPGPNTLDGVITDESGDTEMLQTITVTRITPILGGFGTAWDQANRVLYFVDRESFKLRALDVDTSLVATIADISEFNVAGDLTTAVDVAFDPVVGALYLPARTPGAARAIGIWRFDLQNGTWSEVSAGTRGTGPDWVAPGRIALNAAGDTAYINENPASRIVRVDLATGDRTILSADTVPITDGTGLEMVADIEFDNTTGQLIVLNRSGNSLFGIDPTTGVRTLISSAVRGSGPEPTTGIALGLDSAGGRAFVFTLTSPRLTLEIDLATGDRRELEMSSLGDVRSIAYDTTNDDLLVIELHRDSARRVDAVTGETETINSNGFPGPVSRTVRGCDLVGQQVWSVAASVLYRMGADNVLDPIIGENSEFGGPIQIMRAAPTGSKLFLLVSGNDGSTKLFSYDTVAQTLTLVHDRAASADPALSTAAGLEVSDTEEAVYLFTNAIEPQLVRIDVATGELSVVSGAEIGTGVPFVEPVDLSLNGTHMLLVDRVGGLIEVDLQSGVRTISTIPAPLGTETLDRGPDGTLWLTTYDDALSIYRLAANDLQPVLVADDETPLGYTGQLANLYSIEAGDPLISCSAGIVQIDPVTGRVVVLAR